MGFMSRYEGIERLDIGDGYWIAVKKCLSWAEAEDAERAGVTMKVNPGSGRKPDEPRTSISMDPETKLFEQVLASLVDWNLDDEDGHTWSLDWDREAEKAAKEARRPNWKSPRRKNLERLPRPVFEIVSQFVARANRAPSRDEAGSFPEDGLSSDPVEPDDARDDREVLDGAGILAGAGSAGGHPAST